MVPRNGGTVNDSVSGIVCDMVHGTVRGTVSAPSVSGTVSDEVGGTVREHCWWCG